jgi:hypothetical protein
MGCWIPSVEFVPTSTSSSASTPFRSYRGIFLSWDLGFNINKEGEIDPFLLLSFFLSSKLFPPQAHHNFPYSIQLTSTSMTSNVHAKALNLARRHSLHNENDLLRKFHDTTSRRVFSLIHRIQSIAHLTFSALLPLYPWSLYRTKPV